MARSRVPMVDLRAQYERIRAEVDAALRSVVDSAQFIHGPDCALFEQEFAAFCGVAHACGVANGTDALTLALKALGVGTGDDVVTVANTFIATGEAILLCGARPVFVDVDAATHTMDPGRLEAAITPRTKVLLPVHLYGHPADMDAVRDVARRHGLPVLEDAAQAHGAEIAGRRAGGLGHAACFSFYPGKNLGAWGDAGMVVSDDAAFVARVRQLANHGGGADKYDNVVPGTNSRLDAMQAAVLRVKLRHLAGFNEARRSVAKRYREKLAGANVTLPLEHGRGTHVYHQFTIRSERRDAIREALTKEGIASSVFYPMPLHQQPAYAGLARGVSLPVSEKVSRTVLSLPIHPLLDEASIDRIAACVRKAA
jgi:dTDP-4-amino-4,6-dideoxygalactose transaminase